MLAEQQTEPGECRITTVLFDHPYEILHDRIDIKVVSPITERKYFAQGNTVLHDAIGRTINKIGEVQKNTVEEYHAEKVLFVITTDGMENASREFNYDKIKSMIKRQENKYAWEFIFHGANINVVEVAEHFGVAPSRTQNFHNDSEGIALNYAVVSETVASFRAATVSTGFNDDWIAEIQKDYKRGEKR